MSAFTSALSEPSLIFQKAYIDGQWVDSESNKTFEIFNPATGELLGTCPESTTKDLQSAIHAAAKAFPLWRAQSGRTRGRHLRRLSDLILQHKSDIGKITTLENGKAKADAEGEAAMSSGTFEWFAEEAPRIYGDVVPHSNAQSRTLILKQPIGVCGLITPWNFPMAMGARKIAAALAAGCTVVVKSDGHTPFSTNVLAVLAEKAGIPKGVLNVVTSLNNTPELGLAMCESPIVKKISFTGSTRVGKILARQSADTLKKLSLELGGNAPFIVFDDAHLETAVTSALASKFKVSGQTCVCANRIYVQDGIYDRFSARLVEEVKKFRVGHGADEGVTHGPLTTSVAKVEEHVQDAVAKKATILLGGNRLPQLGPNFFELTVLGDVDDSMKVTTEETFGPLAALTRFKTEEEVVRRANNVEVGLASYLMTSDLSRYHRVSELLEYGMVAVNTGVIADFAAPFGGIKHSGWGREGSKYGTDDYMVYKTVVTGGIDTVFTAHL
ncbi:succinate semialdehyde dehydrogenase [Emericellopsis atlantica]|uniref:succinate-semialdehyde dehydrogenase [NAD(P)(+)] n=1 Tax=Emericellopsis atlantica TaxID=2614577 RepID=A0A9P7ZJP7_9HYPO|nr:succinate semialdehyde dehydrogenase [Emericellopsis atlantica]KAG9252860.1 succinate semialdehyde dehydrogenase [Emericellopsis atlantica]